ncbi:MAG: fluoride exporter [Miltoncostaeaceae bacterium]|jgi:CrcB protein|nr:fluoride exporter [Miltoncostaeaceae bacterium]
MGAVVGGWRVAGAVAVGGACGGVLRTALEARWPAGGGWPWATFAANLVGAALLAWVVARLGARPWARPLLGAGLCGGLTTFSTLQLEAIDLARAGNGVLAASYVAATVAGGLAVAAAVLAAAPRPA